MRLKTIVQCWLIPTSAALLWAASQISVRQAQTILRDKGFYSGKVDGVEGPATRKALAEYQKSQGLPETARLDTNTVARLSPAATTEAAGAAKGAVKATGQSATTEVQKSPGSVKEAGKEAGSSASSETKSALGEVKGVFGKGKSKKKEPPAK